MGASKEKRLMTDLYLLDFEEIEQEWWQDYSEDLPNFLPEDAPFCKRCRGRGCEWCYLIDPVRI